MTLLSRQKIERVIEAMRAHTRHFLTPLSKERPDLNKVVLVGTGNFVMLNGCRVILTCEHVTKEGELNVSLHGNNEVFGYRGPWLTDPPPVDLALAAMTDGVWGKNPHDAKTIPYERFAQTHHTVDPAELLFLHGIAGENAPYGFGVFEPAGSAYCSQEKPGGDKNYFEVFWQPDDIQYTTDTTPEEQERVKHKDARGLSGSLVWNTRYIEVTRSGGQWSPADAVVTGMAHRWDGGTQTLLIYRVEHIRRWIKRSTE
jgi:hypothetical protein